MALKISGTEVVDDSKVLRNTTISSAYYTSFHPAVGTITSSTIDFNKPLQVYTMTANETFGITNWGIGRSTLVVLDTTPNNYLPNFSNDIFWARDFEPGWNSHRYWHIHMICWDIPQDVVSASAIGFDDASVAETITLTGTSASPTDTFSIVTTSSNYARAGFFFQADRSLRYASGNGGNSTSAWLNWCTTTPSQTYYIRGTTFQNTASGSVSDGGDPRNAWLALNVDRSFYIVDTRSSISYGTEHIIMKIEIATDAGGSNIVDTGYYRTEWTGFA